MHQFKFSICASQFWPITVSVVILNGCLLLLHCPNVMVYLVKVFSFKQYLHCVVYWRHRHRAYTWTCRFCMDLYCCKICTAFGRCSLRPSTCDSACTVRLLRSCPQICQLKHPMDSCCWTDLKANLISFEMVLHLLWPYWYKTFLEDINNILIYIQSLET